MKQQIKLLLALQERDLEMDRWRGELAAIPATIVGLKSEIQAAKAALEGAKKEMTQLQLAKKQKELDLEGQESSIRKHATDLNAVKTNEAYRALMGEIDKSKLEKSSLEDQILQLMEQMDQASRVWKEKEAHSKSDEGGLLQKISEWESRQKATEQILAAKEAERETALAALPKKLSDQYVKLRHGKHVKAAVVPIRAEQCVGCHMKVSQNLINEVRRGLKIMTCEYCSRIVYLEETVAVT